MNNEQMVNVPRELLERCDFGKNTAVAMAALPELRALLAQPAAQHQSEPVFMVRSHGSCSWEESNGEGLDIALSMPDEYEVRKFYLHPPTSDGFSAGDMADQGAKAFAARDGEVQELRELEETLRTSIFNKSAENQKLKVDCRRLLDKMAERDALLREVAELDPRGEFLGWHLDGRIDAAISASAEPKPFTTPDCPDCACVQDGQCLCTPSKPSAEPSAPVEPSADEVRQQHYDEFMQRRETRAALERKP